MLRVYFLRLKALPELIILLLATPPFSRPSDSNLPCFSNGELTSQQLRERFMLSLTQAQVEDFCEKLIINAATSSFTRLYE